MPGVRVLQPNSAEQSRAHSSHLKIIISQTKQRRSTGRDRAPSMHLCHAEERKQKLKVEGSADPPLHIRCNAHHPADLFINPLCLSMLYVTDIRTKCPPYWPHHIETFGNFYSETECTGIPLQKKGIHFKHLKNYKTREIRKQK